LHTSRQRIKSQSLEDGRQFRFRTRGFATMQGVTLSALKGGGDALLQGQAIPLTAPATLNVVFLQLPVNALHERVSQYSDEQVTVDKRFFKVVNRAQTKLSVKAAEHGFPIGEHDIGAPQALAVPVGLTAS